MLDPNKRHHKEWISRTVWPRFKKRKTRYQSTANLKQTQVKYTEPSKRVKSTTADKWKYVENLGTTAEQALRKQNMKELDDIIKKLVGEYIKLE